MKRIGLLLATASICANAADKIGNGGQSISFLGKTALRDLVDPGACVWYSGPEIMAKLARLDHALHSLDRYHPVYSKMIRRESKEVTVCMTGASLRPIPAEDQDGVTIWRSFEGQQVAIRLSNLIYIDQRIFNQMDESNRAYLWIHEIMHSFVPNEVPSRNNKLRSFVKFLHGHETQEVNQEFFFRQILMNNVQWPVDATRDSIDEAASQISIALDKTIEPSVRMEAFLTGKDILGRNCGRQAEDEIPFKMGLEATTNIQMSRLEDELQTEARDLTSQIEGLLNEVISRDDVAGLNQLKRQLPKYIDRVYMTNGRSSLILMGPMSLPKPDKYAQATWLKRFTTNDAYNILASEIPSFSSGALELALTDAIKTAKPKAIEILVRSSNLNIPMDILSPGWQNLFMPEEKIIDQSHPELIYEAILKSPNAQALIEYRYNGKNAIEGLQEDIQNTARAIKEITRHRKRSFGVSLQDLQNTLEKQNRILAVFKKVEQSIAN